MHLAAGDTYHGLFITANQGTGAAQDADSSPAATATRNGSDDGAFTLTATKIDTGRYQVSGSVPAGYAIGDQVLISIAATIGGVATKQVIDRFTVGDNAAQRHRALAAIANKRALDQATGDKTIYDDDGATPLYTQTVSIEDDGATVVETPS